MRQAFTRTQAVEPGTRTQVTEAYATVETEPVTLAGTRFSTFRSEFTTEDGELVVDHHLVGPRGTIYRLSLPDKLGRCVARSLNTGAVWTKRGNPVQLCSYGDVIEVYRQVRP